MLQHHPTNITRTSNQRLVPLALRKATRKRRARRRRGSKPAAPRGPDTEACCQDPGDAPRRGTPRPAAFPQTDRWPATEDVLASPGWLWLRRRRRHHAPVLRPLTKLRPKARGRRGRHSRGLSLGAPLTGDTAVEKARRVLARACIANHAGSEGAAIAAKTASGKGPARLQVKGRGWGPCPAPGSGKQEARGPPMQSQSQLTVQGSTPRVEKGMERKQKHLLKNRSCQSKDTCKGEMWLIGGQVRAESQMAWESGSLP